MGSMVNSLKAWASAQIPRGQDAHALRRYLELLAGLVLLAVAGFFFSCSGWGMDPLSVLYSGVSHTLHIQLGTAAMLVGAVVLIGLMICDRKRIGVGTVGVVVVIGPIINVLLRVFGYTPSGWVGQAVSCALGVLTYSAGMACYLQGNLGCGPVDGLMLGLLDHMKITLRTFKILFDIASVVIGWLLGGSVGVGTVAAALLSGPVMCLFMNWIKAAEAKR